MNAGAVTEIGLDCRRLECELVVQGFPCCWQGILCVLQLCQRCIGDS